MWRLRAGDLRSRSYRKHAALKHSDATLFEGSEHPYTSEGVLAGLNVHDSEEGGNEGFTYIILKTWSGSVTSRKVKKIIHLNGKLKENLKGVCKHIVKLNARNTSEKRSNNLLVCNITM